MNVMIFRYALSCWAEFYNVVCMMHNVEYSRIVPWVQKVLPPPRLIPDSSRRGLFAKKMQQNDALFGIAVLSGNI